MYAALRAVRGGGWTASIAFDFDAGKEFTWSGDDPPAVLF
jgi:hypothetical protein